MQDDKPLRVALVGHGFMGAAHSQAWRVAPRFFDLPLQPRMNLLVGRDADRTSAAARKWGWAESATDWREAVTREDIDVVDIVTPGASHAEIAIAALDAGKHVLCEKPLANTVEEAQAMADAAARAEARGVRAMVGFTYRRLPATTHARNLVASGAIGTVRQVRAVYLQDWLVDEDSPLTWRLQQDEAGSGALGDLGAHAIDLAQYITGVPLAEVSGTLATLVPTRPVPEADQRGTGLGGGSAGSGNDAGPRGPVTVDDVALFLGRFEDGVLGSFEASRMATGRKNAFRLEVSGSKGAISFDLEDLNFLGFMDYTVPPDRQGFTRIMVTEPDHPYVSAWWPAGHSLGYEHGFVHQAKDFVEAIAAGTAPAPSFADGLQVQEVLDAVSRSAAKSSVWLPVR
ncbi:Gfo/Idh/MocA family protein [Arthrobacter sp. zg-Y1110]|uniref:Gfo/Idh/MocA family protein n=1 Tax=Arthrobacter sp. zg-Y1110 TaxID=2886932 RepID=UPI001D14B28A|nr:Gfo/Idh/MocA family oxidoreductase [Arthrobacter sp. zg-Y1110]MCC3291753.1 Gfo/Idh/MocA family oxidoreductase [Arthrobacter sp. zg-Y1110]UWX85592.1 Gfo/Idh/MocA family oxidoreductase [Arthrobacter sp. zg-Y1110]